MKKTKNNLNKTDRNTVADQSPEQHNTSLWQDPFVHVLLIMATGFIVYFNSVSVPYMFDDYVCLIDNPAIKSFNCFPDTQRVMGLGIATDLKNNLILRPVSYFTFAINYALHDFDVFGYHLVNLLFHIGCALLVYYLFSRLLLAMTMPDREDKGSKGMAQDTVDYMPLFAALLFVCHPLQTQAVTYIVQRFVPLATFFYLTALAFYVQFRLAATPLSRLLAYTLSLTAAVLAMESKEIAFTLPAIIVLSEFMFFRGNIASRLIKLIPFLLTMAIIPAKLLHLPSPGTAGKTENISSAINLVNFGGISSWDYLMTQFGVITTYIRLLLLPVGQNLDYDYPLQKHFFRMEVLLPLALLLIIVGMGLYLLKRSRENRLYKIIAFGIFWFFITLSVESSIVPIDDLIFEHRVYLPSIGFFMALSAGISVIFSRLTGKSIVIPKIMFLLPVATVLTLSAAAIARNMVWQDELTFWNDVVKKSPNKARPHIALGETLIRQAKIAPPENGILEDTVLLKEGSDKQIRTAVNEFKAAVRLGPNSPAAHVKLAEALKLQKNFDEALRSLSTATSLQPESSIPYVMRGEILEARGDSARARQEYLDAVKIEPAAHMPHMKLADIYAKEGNIQGAIEELEFVMRVHPDASVRKKLAKLKVG